MSQACAHPHSPARRARRAFGAAVTTAGLATALLGAVVQTAAPLGLDPQPRVVQVVSGR